MGRCCCCWYLLARVRRTRKVEIGESFSQIAPGCSDGTPEIIGASNQLDAHDKIRKTFSQVAADCGGRTPEVPSTRSQLCAVAQDEIGKPLSQVAADCGDGAPEVIGTDGKHCLHTDAVSTTANTTTDPLVCERSRGTSQEAGLDGLDAHSEADSDSSSRSDEYLALYPRSETLRYVPGPEENLD